MLALWILHCSIGMTPEPDRSSEAEIMRVVDAGKRHPIRSLSCGIAVLLKINRSGSASLMDIAKAPNLPFPTVSRLVQSLLHERLIEREADRRRYRPSALVQTLAHGFQGNARLVKAARPHIVELPPWRAGRSPCPPMFATRW